MPPEPFAAQMTRIVTLYRELPSLQARYDANPDDLETAGLLASAYARRGDSKRARELIKALEKADTRSTQEHLAGAYMAMGDYYVEKENYRLAAKYFSRAAEIAVSATQMVDARLNRAYTYYMERTRFPLGSRPFLARLKKAEAELVLLVDLPDLPEDRKEQAKQLLEQVKKETQ